MSFWSQGGEDARETATANEDLPSNDFEPIPDKTKVLAMVTEAGIGEKDGNRYAFATMEIVKPEAYARRKIFPRFWVFDDNPNAADPAKKRKNDLMRFAKLDAACGGKLARKNGVPSDEDIAMAFANKQVVVNVMLMTPATGDPLNWYSDYWPKGTKEITEVAAAKKPGTKAKVDDDLDDDIPF